MSATAILYLFVNYDYVVNRIYYVDDLSFGDMACAVLLIILVLEATRRIIGLALPITALIFLVYALFIAQVEPERLLDQLYMTTEGIFGPDARRLGDLRHHLRRCSAASWSAPAPASSSWTSR